jgi:hypothetical protein
MMRTKGELYRTRVVYCEPALLISAVAFYKHAILCKKLASESARQPETIVRPERHASPTAKPADFTADQLMIK